MKTVEFPSNAEIFVDQLKNLQEMKGQEIVNQISDFYITDSSSRAGIVKFSAPLVGSVVSNNFSISKADDYNINVGVSGGGSIKGIAYNCLGQRIAITADAAWSGGTSAADPDTTYLPGSTIQVKDPYGQVLRQSTGNTGIPIDTTATTSTNYVWVDYLQVVRPAGQIITTEEKKSFLVEYDDGYVIIVIQGGTPYAPPTKYPSAVYVGKVTVKASKIDTVDNDETNRKYVAQRGDTVSAKWAGCTLREVTVQEHMCQIGTSLPSDINPHGLSLEDLGIGPDENAQLHQGLFHEKSLINVADPASASSGFYTVSAAPNICIVGLTGSPTDERLNLFQYLYNSGDTLYHCVFSGPLIKTSLFSDLYDSGAFSAQTSGCYYFYIDASNASAPVLTYSVTVPPTLAYQYPIYAVCWDCACTTLCGGHDMRVFKSPDSVTRWSDSCARVDCIGRMGYDVTCNVFEGYNGTCWEPFHTGRTFVSPSCTGATNYTIAHGLTVTPDVVTLNILGGATISGSAWEVYASRGTTNICICTSASGVCFQVFAWKRNV